MIVKSDVIQVPAGIRYLGEWTKQNGYAEDFNFSMFPDNKFILDKELPGCGFTEYCNKSGNEDVILCSPRVMLINNKKDQYGEDVFLVKNEMDKDPGVDKDLNKQLKDNSKIKTEKELAKEAEELKKKNSEIHEKIKKDFKKYFNRMVCDGKPIKILVTYDSYHIIKDLFIEEDSNRFFDSYTVVDEFQSILHDSRFKSSTEMQFMANLKSTKHVIFASATPTLEKYINMLDEFDGLPFYTLDWGTLDPTRIIKPDLDIYVMRSVTEKACQIVKTYLDGNFDSVVVQRDGQPVKIESREAVLYVNSVNHITSIIKKMGLTPDQVLILCSNTDANKRKVKKLGKKYDIGHVPNPNNGESFPMFTFCTRTVYLGADFYSNCAKTFIFSDANIDSLAVDISEDLPQILGRQRLTSNPWKNSATFFYRATADYRKMTLEDFQKELDKKMNRTNDLLQAYNEASTNSIKYNLATTYKDMAELINYKNDYVGVNTVYLKNPNTGEVVKILKPAMNNLVYVNDLRAFDIQQVDYKDRFTVFATISNKMTPDDLINQEVVRFLNVYYSKTTIYDKLKLLSEYDMSDEARNIVIGQIPDNDEIKSYYTVLGPDRLYELGYNVTRIKKELGIKTFDLGLLIERVYEVFNVGTRISLSDIKSTLSSIYKEINYDKTPKAVDLQDFFDVKDCILISVVDGKKKRFAGYEILTSHEQEMRDKLKAMKN